MLKDQDRIFTNLYGMHDRTLKGAMAVVVGRHHENYPKWP